MSCIRASSSRARCGAAQSPAEGSTSSRKSASAAALVVGGGRVVAVVEQRRRRVDVAQHPVRVHGGGLDREPIAVVAAGDHRRVAQAAAQSSHLLLERVAVGRGAGPEIVEKPVGAHGRPGCERQVHQQFRRLASGDRDRLAVSPDLDRAQHQELEHERECRACQRSVSAARDCRDMHQLLRRLVTGDDAAITAIVEASQTSDDPLILVAAALFSPHGDRLLVRAEKLASTTRDRQLVAIAAAHHRGDRETRRRPGARPPRRPSGQRARRLDRRRQPVPKQQDTMNPPPPPPPTRPRVLPGHPLGTPLLPAQLTGSTKGSR